MLYKEFKTINGKYLYDSNTNCIVPISDKLFSQINGALGEEAKQEMNKLQINGFIKKKNLTEIKHPESNNLEKSMDGFIEQLTLQVTQGCNLVCGYCPYSCSSSNQRSHSNTKMSEEIAYKAVDLFYEKSALIDPVTISFYGGEPLLNISLIKKVVKYANDKFFGKKVNYGITTNGTVINSSIFQFFQDNNFGSVAKFF
ncbi:Radical SAM superfamily protein [Enterococcus malodoratus]|uniref:radical SAM protein n=1 Tax=Enterococcus malodoratus TaxID=71451 RepID=UPI0008B8814E|nr:radical SAM protein [Enterococcus malodoratus]SEU02798.1 Radical SAM superfamily protein [Enterococcus malodoratus]